MGRRRLPTHRRRHLDRRRRRRHRGAGHGRGGLVTTHGVSMLPRFHTGDLAVIVPRASYHVGDIVGYHSPLLHITVLHRIVAEHGGLFTFKGDHNDFLDPSRAPGLGRSRAGCGSTSRTAGTVLGWVRSPVVLGMLAFLVVALGIGGRRVRRQRAAVAAPAGLRAEARSRRHGINVGGGRLAVPSALALAFGFLGATAWARPLTRPTDRPVPMPSSLRFCYSASADPRHDLPDRLGVHR